MNDRPVILTIDDEAVIRESLRAYLEDCEYSVLTAENGKDGLALINREKIDLVLVDLRMPEVDGLEVLEKVREDKPDLPVIVVSGTGEIQDVVDALRLGAWNYLLKPISDMSILLHAIESGLEKAHLKKENKNYQHRLEGMVDRKTLELSEVNERLKEVVISARKLIGCGKMEESGGLILREFGHHLDATGGSLYKVEHDGLRHIASLDNGPVVEKISFPLNQGSVFHKVFEEREPLFLPDINGQKTVVPSNKRNYPDSSLLVFPLLKSNGDMLAIVSLHSKKEPPFVSQDRDIGIILASYSSEALQKAEITAALKASEDRLRQAQKMEAIGTLAGGIAHDFNNILAAIIGYTDLSLFSGSCDDIVKNNLEQVKKASNRAKDLVAQILAFSRTDEFKEKAVDISPVIREALKLLRATIPSSIEIDAQVEDGLGRVKTEPTQIYQVLMNLCTNAAQAMHNGGGVLGVSYRKITKADGPPEIQGRDYPYWLVLSVSDNGEGIREEHLEKIFDPYFTTKDKGEGTGLGLAVVHGIVRASGGMAKVNSTYGEGSSFELYFPCLDINVEVKEEDTFIQLLGGNESILFVDDETTLADMAGEMLRKLGYSVQVLTNSVDALDHFESNPEAYDLLITDQTMPEMSGMDFAREVLSLRDDIPVILYTGYSATIDAKEAKRIGIKKFLMKPLSMRVLADAVRSALDEN